MTTLRLVSSRDPLHDWQDDGDGPFCTRCGVPFSEARKLEACSRAGADDHDPTL